MNNSIFITGTDTNIGKTFISLGIALFLKSKGKKIGYFKPFQSGAFEKNNELIAPDIEEFKPYPDIKTKYSYLLKNDVSPHLASLLSNVKIDINKVKNDFIDFSKNNDFTIIEGAGGLYCPAFEDKTFADIINFLNQEIIIVTTPELGKLNHALMTIDCAKNKNIKIKGLIINKIPQNPTLSEENFIKELKIYTDEKILGTIPKMQNPTENEIIKAFSLLNL